MPIDLECKQDSNFKSQLDSKKNLLIELTDTRINGLFSSKYYSKKEIMVQF